jgi:hypothetical protein
MQSQYYTSEKSENPSLGTRISAVGIVVSLIASVAISAVAVVLLSLVESEKDVQ